MKKVSTGYPKYDTRVDDICDGGTVDNTLNSNVLGGCPFNGPLSGTKCCVPYPKRFYAEVIVTVFKTSQLCAVVHCCAQVLVEHCTEFRTSFISN